MKKKKRGIKGSNKIKSKTYCYNKKMNVKLATQVLSSSLSCALKFCETFDSNFTNVEPTTAFCMIMNNAFYIMNCRTKYS